MRSNFTLGLAAIAFGFGIASSAAAPPDFNLKSTSPPSKLIPQGDITSGFSTIRMNRDNSLRENGLMRSEENRTWREGLTVLAAGFATEEAISQSIAQRQALMSLQGMQPTPHGFAVIKATRPHGGPDRLENQLSGTKAVPNNFFSPPSK
jgi:hypothetical protein